MASDDGKRSRDDAKREAVDAFERLFRSSTANAAVAWVFVGILVVGLVETALDWDLQWLVFVSTVGVIVLIPAVAYRDWRVMLPAELLVIALLPILVRGLFGGQVGTFAAYLSIAGLALIVTVELHMFTELKVTQWFAVSFVVLTTMASVAAWTVVRWQFDRHLGTAYLTTNEALMREWVSVMLAGLAAGVLFDAYFRRRDRQLRRAIGRVVWR